MIISAPTALYVSILPDGDESGNVTWNISSNDPPRTIEITAIIPIQEELKPVPAIVFNPESRQINTGPFIFNVSYTKKSKVGIGNRMFESGQVLEFDDVESVETSLLAVPETIDLQQDLNYVDYSVMGLTEDQINRLTSESRKKYNDLVSNINVIVSNINSTGTSISDNQKKINETRKTYNASSVSLGEDDEITVSLKGRLESLNNIRTQLVAQYNSDIGIANGYYDQILKIKELVR